MYINTKEVCTSLCASLRYFVSQYASHCMYILFMLCSCTNTCTLKYICTDEDHVNKALSFSQILQDSDSFESQYAIAAQVLIASTLDSSAESTNDNEIRKSTKAKSEPPSNIVTVDAQSLSPDTAARDYRSPSEVHEQLSTDALKGTTCLYGEDCSVSLYINPELHVTGASVLEPDDTSTAAVSELAKDNVPVSLCNGIEQKHPRGLPEIQPVSTKLSKSLGRLIKETERMETERLEAEKKEAERLEAEKKRLDADKMETARLLAEKVKATEQVDGVNRASAEVSYTF